MVQRKLLLPTITKLTTILITVTLILAGCGGGGGGGSGSGGAAQTFPGTVTSTLSFPLQIGMANSVKNGLSANFTVSGTCSGSASLVDATPISAIFEGASVFSVASTQTINFTNCTPATTTGTQTSYYDNNYLPAGTSFSGDYGVFLTPTNIPATVKVGDTGAIGTQNNYTDNTKTVFTGQDIISYVIEPDTATTAIVNLIDKTYNSSGVLTSTQQDRYRIVSNGTMTYISSDIQEANGSTTHIVLTALPDTTPPTVVSTSPTNNLTAVSVGAAITATFSEAIDSSTVTAATYTLSGGVTGTVTSSGRTATFTPASPLAYNTPYTATVTTGVKDLAGNPMSANYSWTFTTASAPFVPNPSPLPPLSQSVAYQIDYAHSGQANLTGPITFPNTPTWSVTLSGAASYPLIAGGKVFVLTAGLSSGSGTLLYALDKVSGSIVWGPVAIAGSYHWAGHAYDHGKLFVINSDGLLQSFDAVTGVAGWTTQLPNQYFFAAPPTAVNGIVYVGGSGTGGTLYAVDELNGNLLWTSSVANGDFSSPTVSTDGVFVSYPCQVYKFDPLTGTSIWHYSGACEGGGGETSPYANGMLYVRDIMSGGLIFNAASGVQTGSFSAPYYTVIPALNSQDMYLQNAGTLQAIDLTSHSMVWSFTGDGHLVSAPIIINTYVIIGSSLGNVYALDGATGAQIWSSNAGAPIAGPNEGYIFQPVTGFGAGEGYLVVPAGNILSAWQVGP